MAWTQTRDGTCSLENTRPVVAQYPANVRGAEPCADGKEARELGEVANVDEVVGDTEIPQGSLDEWPVLKTEKGENIRLIDDTLVYWDPNFGERKSSGAALIGGGGAKDSKGVRDLQTVPTTWNYSQGFRGALWFRPCTPCTPLVMARTSPPHPPAGKAYTSSSARAGVRVGQWRDSLVRAQSAFYYGPVLHVGEWEDMHAETL